MHQLKIGVLMGGRSIECEVSLNSGRTVCDHLDTTRYTVIPLYQKSTGQLFVLPWRFLHRGKTKDFEHRLEDEAEQITWDDLKKQVDLLYIAMHGRYAEDGTLQGLLEVLTIPYVGSKILASALGMNKSMQKDFLRICGIKTPHNITLEPYEIEHYKKNHSHLFSYISKNNLMFPVIVKPNEEGSSLGVTKVSKKEALFQAIEKACSVNPNLKQSVLIEQCIYGMEFSCIVITDYKTGHLQALPPTEIVIEQDSDIFDYDQKYMPGRATKYTPARVPDDLLENIKKTSTEVCKALDFTNIARIDGFITETNEIYITDPNSFCGMGPASYPFLQAAEVEMNHSVFINHLIETELLYNQKIFEIMLNDQQKKENLMKTAKKRIAVLLGGTSNEREISLESGRNISYKISPQKYETTTLFVNKDLELYAIPPKILVRNTTQEIEEAITPDLKIQWSALPQLFDFVFIGLHGGVGENGGVQGALEMLSVPYNGSPVLASALCMDKYKTNSLLQSKGFAVPHNHLISKSTWQDNPLSALSFDFPVIIKPHDDGCSILVQKADNQQELNNALKKLFATGKDYAMIEEYIIGMELTIGVIGNQKPVALPPSYAIASKNILSIEEKFLPGAGENQTPAPLPEKTIGLIQNIVENVYKTVGCKGYARVDCFYQSAEQSPTKKERVVIIEINTLPAMTPATCLFHQAAEIGIKPMDFVDLIIQLGFEHHTQKPCLNEQQKKMLEEQQSDLTVECS